MQESWIELVQYALQTNKQPAVFQSLLLSVTIVPDMTLPSPLATVFIDVERVAPGTSSTDIIVAEELPASVHASYMKIAVPVSKRENQAQLRGRPKNFT